MVDRRARHGGSGRAGSLATTVSTSDLRKGPAKDLGSTLLMWNVPNIVAVIILELCEWLLAVDRVAAGGG